MSEPYKRLLMVVSIVVSLLFRGDTFCKGKINEPEKCAIAGLLHDISAIIKPADMLEYAYENGFAICEAERKYSFLLHQRLSKICAVEYFNILDEEILSAIECHTPPYSEEVNAALNISLEAACYKYMQYMIDNDMILCPHDNWIEAYGQLKDMGEVE